MTFMSTVLIWIMLSCNFDILVYMKKIYKNQIIYQDIKTGVIQNKMCKSGCRWNFLISRCCTNDIPRMPFFSFLTKKTTQNSLAAMAVNSRAWRRLYISDFGWHVRVMSSATLSLLARIKVFSSSAFSKLLWQPRIILCFHFTRWVRFIDVPQWLLKGTFRYCAWSRTCSVKKTYYGLF